MNDTITVVGRIGTEPEHRLSTTGIPITSFRVGSSQRVLDRVTGEWSDSPTSWYTVSTYRALAEHAFLSLRKGDRVILAGRLHVREWDNGTKKGVNVDIDADAIGHDLLWGTTRYEKDAGGASGSASLPPAEAADSSEESDRWATPSAESWAVPGESAAALDRELELVVASGAPAEVETPF